jgi:single-strand DNA-binding protein
MLNKVMLIGNLGRDPEIRTTQSGKSVANLNVATTKKWKDSSGIKQERTEWHRVVSFAEKLNDSVIKPYVKKGDKIYIEGELQTRKWEKDGVDKYSTEVVINAFGGTLYMLGGDKRNEMSPGAQAVTMPAPDAIIPDDEIPF